MLVGLFPLYQLPQNKVCKEEHLSVGVWHHQVGEEPRVGFISPDGQSSVGAEKPMPSPGQALVHGQHLASARANHLFSLTWVLWVPGGSVAL